MKEIKASTVSMRTRNPIRQIVDNLKVVPNPDKKFLSLALGDPTTFGNFKVPKRAIDSITDKLHNCQSNGYGPSVGLVSAREAIAELCSFENITINANDVIITSGCSDALNLCIGSLCDEGQNIILPMPGFSLYETLASSKGIDCKFYRLDSSKQWEADVEHLESLIDSNTACIVVNNPSNPCGSVYSKAHLIELLSIAEKYSLPIIADEIYADMIFKGQQFFPMASLSKRVPILSCGGLAKKYFVPGWRIGWICIYDYTSALTQVRVGLNNCNYYIKIVSQLIIGANTLIQSSIPDILKTEQCFHDENMAQLEKNAYAAIERLKGIRGIEVIAPQGAMYLMVINTL
jgi:tyrosine aminotransferase